MRITLSVSGDQFESGGATTMATITSVNAPIGSAPVLLFKVGVNP